MHSSTLRVLRLPRLLWVALGMLVLPNSRAAALEPEPGPMRGDWLLGQAWRATGVFQGADPGELVLENGLVARRFRLRPNAVTVALDHRITGEAFVRAVRPEAELVLDGRTWSVGGVGGQPIGNYLAPAWLAALKADPDAFQFVGFSTNRTRARFEWMPRPRWATAHPPWPTPGVELTLSFGPPDGQAGLQGLRVDVHHELYDGLPVFGKWLTVSNGTGRAVRLSSFTSERLACVEATSEVEELIRPRLPNVHVETDFTTVAMSGEAAQRQTVQWLTDSNYTTQVNYRLQTPCVLEVRPPLGPDLMLPPGAVFESFRTWLLLFDSRDEVRRTLALGRMYRALAPWTAENPLIFHVRDARPEAVKLAIDQCADVGFELVILTFGSGFDLEDHSPAALARIRQLADYAHDKGIAFGGYSLLASRSIGPDDDVVNPDTGRPGGFATFGSSPCLGSRWGQDYFRKLYAFFEQTGCDVLEHDGSYPGDACASTNHPGHSGYADSRWRQWETIAQFYRWCRARGIYLNVPDWYFLHGSSKTGMGYRETNWSLPREHQEIIERQNILDGTRYKTPTMGWMFVPLTEYHGGGAAATIEPLHEHRDHYERRLANLLGAGVQACFRGPRLYDTPETRALVKRWVDFYKEHRAILDSDLIPLRRADGRDWDGWLHVNPGLATPALAMVYNPLNNPVERRVRFPLYFASLRGEAGCLAEGLAQRTLTLDAACAGELDLKIPARGNTWVVFSPREIAPPRPR